MSERPAEPDPRRPFPLLFDSHCHLHDQSFDGDRSWVIRRARQRGVGRVLSVAEDLDDAFRLLQVAGRHPSFLLPALGVHPDRAALLGDGEVAALATLMRERAAQLGAVGEVGLDHRPCWDERARGRQEEVFRFMIRLALELSLPLSVHSRAAGRRAVAILEEEGAGSVCLHAFDGRAVHGERAAALGFAFSLGPALVRTRVQQKLVPRLPLAALLLETDSPVLGPCPGRRNEPANLPLALKEMGRLRGIQDRTLAQLIGENTARVFPGLSLGQGP